MVRQSLSLSPTALWGYFSGLSVSFDFLFPGTLTPSLPLASLLCLKVHLTHLRGGIQLAHRAPVCYVWKTEAMCNSHGKPIKTHTQKLGISLAAELMINIIILAQSTLTVLLLRRHKQICYMIILRRFPCSIHAEPTAPFFAVSFRQQWTEDWVCFVITQAPG